MSRRRGQAALRRLLFWTPSERADRKARFTRDMRALRAALALGPAPGEAREEFIERLLTGLEGILARDPLGVLRRPVPRGRPPAIERLWAPPPAPPAPRGRPRCAAPVAEIVALVDDRKRRLGLRTDVAALAQLLYEGAPPELRARMDARRREIEEWEADTPGARQRALGSAVEDLEGPRRRQWLKRISRARRATASRHR